MARRQAVREHRRGRRHSGLDTIAPDGTVTKLRDDGTRYFGEGLTILNDEIFQLTWQEHDRFSSTTSPASSSAPCATRAKAGA